MVDWSKISAEFKEIRALLITAPSPPSVEEIDAHKISLKRGIVSPLTRRFRWGFRSYFGSAEREDRLSQLAKEISSGGIPENCPDFIVREFRNSFIVVEEAIEAKIVSTEFLLAWGYLNQLLGRYLELALLEGSDEKKFHQNMNAGLSQDATLQRYWHAHWIGTHARPDMKNRVEIEYVLAKLCVDVWQGRLSPPAGFANDWFGSMIVSEDGCKPIPPAGYFGIADLKTPYKRATVSEIREKMKNRLISREMMPPLTIAEFNRP
jgi:hypothetical protein